MRSTRREVVGYDRERHLAFTGPPGRELLQSGSTCPHDTIGPLEIGAADIAWLIGERRDVVSHGDGDRSLQRTRVASPGDPGRRVAATDERLLLLGDELVVPPESGQGPPDGDAD